MGTLAFTTHLARGKSRDLQFLGRVNDSGAFDSVEILPFITVEEIGLESCAVVHVRVRTPATGISWQITSSMMPPFGAPRTCSHSRPSIPAVGRCSAGSGCPLPCPTRRVQCACSGSRSMVDPSWRSEIGGGRMSFVIPEETMCSSFGERVFLSMLQAEPSSVRLRGGHSRSRERRDCCVLRGQIRD